MTVFSQRQDYSIDEPAEIGYNKCYDCILNGTEIRSQRRILHNR